MKIRYDAEVDALYIDLVDAEVQTSDEVAPGIIFDYDAGGAVVGIELLDASERVADPENVQFDRLPAPS